MSAVAETGRFRFVIRSIEIAANFATLVVAGLLCVVLVRSYLLPAFYSPPLQGRPASMNPADVAAVGTNLSNRLFRR